MGNLSESINHLKQIINEAIIDKRITALEGEIQFFNVGKILDEYQGLKLINIIKNKENNKFYAAYQVDGGEFFIYIIKPNIILNEKNTIELNINIDILKDDLGFNEMVKDGVRFDQNIMDNLMQF
jgi:hypothetical protein